MGHKTDPSEVSKDSPRRASPAASMVLFVGGQHHGKMLPVCELSLKDPFLPVLQAETSLTPYAGYHLHRLDLAGGGTRILAVHEACRHRGQAEAIDALATALEDCERVLRTYRRTGRFVPRNSALDDEPGKPAKRKPTRADGNGVLARECPK